MKVSLSLLYRSAQQEQSLSHKKRTTEHKKGKKQLLSPLLSPPFCPLSSFLSSCCCWQMGLISNERPFSQSCSLLIVVYTKEGERHVITHSEPFGRSVCRTLNGGVSNNALNHIVGLSFFCFRGGRRETPFCCINGCRPIWTRLGLGQMLQQSELIRSFQISKLMILAFK